MGKDGGGSDGAPIKQIINAAPRDADASHGVVHGLTFAALGWLSLSLLYAALLYTQSQGAMGALVSARVALQTTFVPASMGVGVWWLTGRYTLPARGLFAFVATHFILGVAFAAIWAAWMLVVATSAGPRMSGSVLLRSVVPWHAVMGVLLYGLIAGTSYAVRQGLRAERADRLRAQADLAALRAHIDPHFFFNTLHSLNELLQVEPAAASEAVERLASLFRYTLKLDRQDVDCVTLDEEWRFTESYLWLERLRLDGRLSIDAQLDDDALACAIPPFTLQPIIENAVRHGVSQKSEGGTIRIRAIEDDGALTLTVTDDGPGTSAESVAASRGLGIRSVRQRLDARYGSPARVEVTTPATGGTCVRITLPAELAR